MSMLPFFPSLRPPFCSFDIDIPCDDEAEITALEQENITWSNSFAQSAHNLNPIGKVATEHLEGPDTDEDEGANDDTDDSESHDDEDEDEEPILSARTTMDADRTEDVYTLGSFNLGQQNE